MSKIFNIRVTFSEKEFSDDSDIRNVLETLAEILTYDTKGITVEVKKVKPNE